MNVWPNPWDEFALSDEVNAEEVVALIEQRMLEGGPLAQRRWRSVVAALREDSSMLMLWRLTSMRGGQTHPWDEALEALRRVPAFVPVEAPAVKSDLVHDEERQAVLRDLLELPSMPPREMVKEGILGLMPEKIQGEE